MIESAASQAIEVPVNMQSQNKKLRPQASRFQETVLCSLRSVEDEISDLQHSTLIQFDRLRQLSIVDRLGYSEEAYREEQTTDLPA